jgi:hypothetical protein
MYKPSTYLVVTYFPTYLISYLLVHAPAISLGQKWQRTQVSEKNSCSQWGEL